MRKNLILAIALFCAFILRAQDSVKTKLLNHEIGFNTVSLIKQLASNSPTVTATQLPYDFFYNIYYKDLIGLRFGAGVTYSKQKTQDDTQQYPRQTVTNNYLIRSGISYNFVRTKRLTFNGFIDYAFGKSAEYTSSTSTVQTFPNPVETTITETSDETKTWLVQAGVGVKYNITRHLSIYTEVPYAFISDKTTSSVNITNDGVLTTSSTKSTLLRSKIYLPTTVYLVLRF